MKPYEVDLAPEVLESYKQSFQAYAEQQKWCDETLRARWDGAKALISWWHGPGGFHQLPLRDISSLEAQAFLTWLAEQGLARATIKGYRIGAAALIKALELASGEESSYLPFRGAKVTTSKQQAIVLDEVYLQDLNAFLEARIRLLVALLNLGMSISEVCSCTWADYTEMRILSSYKGKRYTLSMECLSYVLPLRDFAKKKADYKSKRLLGWTPATARSYLKSAKLDLSFSNKTG